MSCHKHTEDTVGIQQDDNYRELMGWITDGGLRYACAKFSGQNDANTYYRTTMSKNEQKHILIVGAGMAGLSAAYELSQIGHKVTILEAQSRVGGRVKTFREGFQDGLHCEGGAMRLPGNHYLTHHYIDLFEIATRDFQNVNNNAYLCLYGEKIRMWDWKENNGKWTDHFFPGWDANIPASLKKSLRITGILDLYAQTMKPVIDELGPDPDEDRWQTFVNKWSRLSLENFLRSPDFQEGQHKLRPWTEEAITAYKVSTYTPLTGSDVASYLREELGGWWKDPLVTITDGMDILPKSFVKKNKDGWNKDVYLSEDIVFGCVVTKVEEVEKDNNIGVKVSGVNRFSGDAMEYEGDFVIITVPLNILRQIDIPSFDMKKMKAVSDVTYEPSTKLMLQCKTRFWQKDVGQGGFSKTNMVIGQLHYPDYNGSGIPDDERGILLVYTWGKEALTFGAEPERIALSSALNEISKIHPDIHKEFEVGNVQAWYSDPFAQGAFAQLKPYEYLDAMHTLTTPTKTIHLAGEALSWTNGWIQGAIFSSLMQAFCLTKSLMTQGKKKNRKAQTQETCPCKFLLK